ncbi:cupin domain-containing protein [Endozoicomonas arenosclerae]|uniref:cupin domain-containing protein n=1 Tax=Endozoicomonas arenosclerae TaxID=1633495 RepID=UPI0007823FED|nr:cupin domain-containing protein [Endozoicomonas arenosclerae]
MLNMNLQESIIIQTSKQTWQPSPASQVLRKPLAREEKESGHATSIVQYAVGAKFPEHPHPAGEEILVLSGTFSDETGDFHQGSYIRNPPGTRHSPFSKEGCIIFVKLCQFDPADTKTVRVDTLEVLANEPDDQIKEIPLHQFQDEKTSIVRIPAGQTLTLNERPGGLELLVISGRLDTASEEWSEGTWIRTPEWQFELTAVAEETCILVKSGHLHQSL